MEQLVPMKFEENITLNGVDFTLVKIQRDGISAIYKSQDKTKILRIGDKVKVEKDLINYKKLIQQGYPVSVILEEGEDNKLGYFIEKSLGENLFGQVFKSDYELVGRVSDENFDLLIEESKKLLSAQIKNSILDNKAQDTIRGVHLDWLVDELPEEKDRIEKRLELALQRLKDFPFVFSHGDYNPYNTFPDGIIDFEDGFYAPILFDVYGLLVYPFHFPTKGEIELEINGGYKYSEEQRKKYLDEMDKILLQNGLPKGSDFFEEIKFLKGIWLAVRMHKWPKMQQYRYRIFKELLN